MPSAEEVPLTSDVVVIGPATIPSPPHLANLCRASWKTHLYKLFSDVQQEQLLRENNALLETTLGLAAGEVRSPHSTACSRIKDRKASAPESKDVRKA